MLRIVEYCFRHYSVIVDSLPKYLNSHYLLIFPLQQSDIQALGAIYKFFKPQKMEKMPNTGNRSGQLNSQFVLHYLTLQHLNGPAVKQIWKRRFFLWEADGPSVWDRSRWTHGGNPGQRTLKLQLAKGKKINTMKTLGQIPPITQVKWSLHVVLDRAENRICFGHWVFSHLFTGQEQEWQAGCTRVRKVTLETIQNEWVCIPAKPALFASGVGSLSAGAEGDFCSQNSLVCFAASHERLSLNTTGRVPEEGWWHPSSALSDSTADLYFRFWKELFAILLGLTFPLAELATVTRPSDVFSTGKALKQSKMLCLVQSFLSGETSLTQGGFQEVCSPNCACERRVYCFFDCFNIYRRFLFKNICFSFQYVLCPQILLWRNPILWSGLLCSDPGRNVRCLNDILWVYFFGY